MSTLVIPHFSLFIAGWIRLTIYRLIYYRLTRNESHNGNRLTKIMPGVPPGVPPPNDGYCITSAVHSYLRSISTAGVPGSVTPSLFIL
jgi:hypothetical protein